MINMTQTEKLYIGKEVLQDIIKKELKLENVSLKKVIVNNSKADVREFDEFGLLLFYEGNIKDSGREINKLSEEKALYYNTK